MPHKIIAVEPGSTADQLGIRPGDSLVTINEIGRASCRERV